MIENFEDFDWKKYETWNGVGMTTNDSIIGQDQKTKVYSHEHYAQQLFDIYNNSKKIVGKDLNKGDAVSITNMTAFGNGKVMLELLGGLSIDVDMAREKRFMQLFGFENTDDFISMLSNETKKSSLLNQGLIVLVTESVPNMKVSLWQGYVKKAKEEFMKEINAPSKAYVAKIMEANRGGFFVEVQGVEAFMPGSLAAPNKIIDFQSYVGKEVIVMIEDFLPEMNSFIVSHKKYIEYVLPKKLEELDLSKKYSGTVTGASKYGIFVEFEEIFTGLLHQTKMKEDTLKKFENFEYRPGMQIDFYVSEITKDNRIILTEESPEEKRFKIKAFIETYQNSHFIGEVVAIMNFGIIVNVDELSGVVPNKEFKKIYSSPKNFIVGDKMLLEILEIKEDDKLLFTFHTNNKKNGEA